LRIPPGRAGSGGSDLVEQRLCGTPGDHGVGDLVGVPFPRITRSTDVVGEPQTLPLLDRMRSFVRGEPKIWRSPETHTVTGGEGECPHPT
jgi:hypothetical protein